ncbi:ATP-binding protein [Cyanobium sp. ATX 6F1]|uniref:ATP-binding protein n=1 Tax=unclassified Cyanobium TaxID=2627006 RepID=UPI003965793D
MPSNGFVLSTNTVGGSFSKISLLQPVVWSLSSKVIESDAILNRLPHHSHVVTISGDSYRLRKKRRSWLFRTQVGGSSPSLPAKEA